MKKFILLLAGILFTTTSAFALIDHYKTFKAGKYICPESGNMSCEILKDKNGDLHFSEDCLEVKDSKFSKYAPMINRGQCRFFEDTSRYYVCEFADATCDVSMFEKTSSVSCTVKKNLNLSQQESIKINSKVLRFAEEGKCREKYPADKSKIKKH